MPLIDITTKGRIRLTLNGVELSQHVVETEAIEKALAHANTHGDGTYVLKYPEKHLRVIGTQADPETGLPVDTQAPTKPGTPTEVSKGATFVSFQWTPSVDNIGVAGYQIWLNGSPYGAPTTLTNGSVTGQQPSTPLTIRVNAFDAAGNQSELSDALVVTTNANAAPSWNAPQQELTTGVSYTLVLTTVCSDADSNPITFSIVSGTLPTGLTFNSVAKTVSGTPTTVQTQAVTFRADDGITFTDQSITFRVLNADTTAPTTPGQPTASNITANGCTLTWSAVTDQTVANARTSGLAGYRVRRDGGLRADVGNVTTYNESGLSGSTAYDFTIRAYDSAGNESTDSTVRTVTTAAAATAFSPASGFSLTDNGDGTFTLTDTTAAGRFGTKPNGEKALLWYPFETDINPHPTLSRQPNYGFLSTQSGANTLDTGVAPPNSSASFRVPFLKNQVVGGQWGNVVWAPTNPANARCYMWTKRRFNAEYGDRIANGYINLKNYRFHPANGVSSVPGATSQYIADGGPVIFVEDASGWQTSYDGYNHYRGHHPMPANQWYVDEIVLKNPSAPNVFDGIWRWMRNAVDVDTMQYGSGRIGKPFHYAYTTPNMKGELSFDQNSNSNLTQSAVPNPLLLHTDALYVDDSFCRVMISSETSWRDYAERQSSGDYGNVIGQTEIMREVQPIVSWTPNAVRFSRRLGSYASFSGLNVYVVKSDETAVRGGAWT